MTVKRLAELRHTPSLLLAQKVLRRVPFRPVDVGKLCFLRLERIPQIVPGLLRGPGIVRAATPDDLDALATFHNHRDVFQDRFAEGDRCAVAEVAGRIVGYEWFCVRDIHEETAWGYRIVIPAGYVYAYDAFIDPRYRNSGIWLRFKGYLADLMRETGHTGVLTFVDYGNWPSLRTHLRFGFKPDTEVFVIKILGKLVSSAQSAAAI
ncbi:MAG TPA: GNAT family N-acetyltransferase [Vicinamibacterales bacterium]